MLVNTIQCFDFNSRRILLGENLDVLPAIAAQWIADGKAVADGNGIQDPWPGYVVPRLTEIPYIISGYTLPSSGALTNYIAGGDAVINGVRVAKGPASITLPASKDNYIDLTDLGAIVVSSVANGTTSGAGIFRAPNSVRLGKVVTGVSTITSATMSGKDFNNDCMGNLHGMPACILNGGNFQAYQALTAVSFVSSEEIYDNAQMHSLTVSPSRVTVPVPGLYEVKARVFNSAGYLDTSLSIYRNGSVASGGVNRLTAATGIIFSVGHTLDMPLAANDYLEAYVSSTQVGQSIAGAFFSVFKKGAF
jgi:hypothetical protein